MELPQNLLELNIGMKGKMQNVFVLENKKFGSGDRIKGLFHLIFRLASSENYQFLFL